MKRIELWADSFHEGQWCCAGLGDIATSQGGTHKISYLQGFIPVHTIKLKKMHLELIVYGSYKLWHPIPETISDLLDWGKPDFIAYDAEKDKIIFAVEETAAVPTGNQALQRCERIYGSARNHIPFWYLLSEYGQHKDGGIRRDSIWPTIMSLKLTETFKVPSVVLHYSDESNPEDYAFGEGVKSLFNSLIKLLYNDYFNNYLLEDMDYYLTNHYKNMLNFIDSQWDKIIEFLPGEKEILTNSEDLSRIYAEMAVGKNSKLPIGFLQWPTRKELPIKIEERLQAKPLIKFDSLCTSAEKDVKNGNAYYLSRNAGSRPQPYNSLKKWIEQQKKLFDKTPNLEPPAKFNMKISDFPRSPTKRLHLSTSRNILYLYDHWYHLRQTIEKAYPRLRNLLPTENDDISALMYISNSVTPGRIFGDPYTGQLSAFSTIFGKMNPSPRLVITYFPHQSYFQALPSRRLNNKGINLMRELTDLLIFTEGVAIDLKNKKVY